MANFCLTDIKKDMTIITVMYNDESLEFYMEPHIFKNHFKDSKVYTINCTNVSRRSFVYSVNHLFEYLHDDDSDDYEVFNITNVLMFMDITFKEPLKILKNEGIILYNYDTMIDICSETKNMIIDNFNEIVRIITEVFPKIVTSCSVSDSNNNTSTCCIGGRTEYNSEIIESEYVTGPMCFFKNYGTIKKISYGSSPKYNPKYDIPYTFDGNDYVKSLYRVLKYMSLRNKGFMPRIVLDTKTQMRTLLSSPLFYGITDDPDFDDYVAYVDDLLKPPVMTQKKKCVRPAISDSESSDNDL